MPVLSRVQRSSTDELAEMMIHSKRPFISLVMSSQLALENRKNFLGFCLINCGRMSMSVTIIA